MMQENQFPVGSKWNGMWHQIETQVEIVQFVVIGGIGRVVFKDLGQAVTIVPAYESLNETIFISKFKKVESE